MRGFLPGLCFACMMSWTVCADELLDVSRIPELVKLLDSELAKVRGDAAYHLAQYGPEAKSALPTLITMLSDDRTYSTTNRILGATRVSNDAFATLVAMGSESVAVLETATSNRDLDVRSRAVMALGRIGLKARPAIQSLVSLATDTDPALRKLVIETLSQIDRQGDESISVFLKGLTDQDNDVRRTAAKTLGRYRDHYEETVPVLVRSLKDREPIVRATAVQALGELGKSPKRVVYALIDRLDDHATYGSFSAGFGGCFGIGYERHVSDDVIKALGRFGTAAEKAGPRLVELLATEATTTNVESVASAIVRLGPTAKPLLPRLIEILQQSNSQSTQVAILHILGNLGPHAREAVPAIRETLARVDRNSNAKQLSNHAIPIIRKFLKRSSIEIDPLIGSQLTDPADIDEVNPTPAVQLAANCALVRIDPEGNAAAFDQLLAEILRRSEDKFVEVYLSDPSGDLIFETLDSLGQSAKQVAPIFKNLLDRDAVLDLKTRLKIDKTLEKLDPDSRQLTKDITDLLVKGIVWSDLEHESKAALKGLGHEAIWSLIDGLAEFGDDQDRCIEILEVLGEFGEQADPGILTVLGMAKNDNRRDVRAAATMTVGKIRTTPEVAVPVLIRLLDDERPVVREQAVLSLAAYGQSAHAAVEKLTKLRNDDYIDVRAAVEVALDSVK